MEPTKWHSKFKIGIEESTRILWPATSGAFPKKEAARDSLKGSKTDRKNFHMRIALKNPQSSVTPPAGG